MVHNCNLSYSGSQGEGAQPQAGLGQSARPYMKNKLKQMYWGCGSRDRVLSSNLSTTNKQIMTHLIFLMIIARKREGGRERERNIKEERRERGREE
jgi:hypothetical protein